MIGIERRHDSPQRVEDIVREISAMTPGAYYHMGGDEVQKLNRAQYIGVVERMQGIVSKNGKRMVGWADIAPANLSSNTIVQHWEKDSGLRIDHLLLNKASAGRLVDAGVDKDVRGRPGASDHAPTWIVVE